MPKVKLENEQTEKTVTENSVNETDEKLEDAAESVDMRQRMPELTKITVRRRCRL